MASTASSMLSTLRAVSASASMKAWRLLRTISEASEAILGISTGRSAVAICSILRTRSLMLFAESPTRSRSALILMTLRMKRRSMAMGCSMASRSRAAWSMSRSSRLMATSLRLTRSQMERSRTR